MGERALPRVWVVGLSDIGRSPRMQNHAISLATQGGYEVDVIGQGGSTPLPELSSHKSIHLHRIPETAPWVQKLPRPLRLPLKALTQLFAMLLLLLFRVPKPQVLLLQVPPAIPTLFICWLVCLLRGARLIIDWHNFGYTLMAIGAGGNTPLVKFARSQERFWGRRAHAHLCVTQAMQKELQSSWGIPATVFHDRAPTSFKPTSLQQKHALLVALADAIEKPVHPHDWCRSSKFEADSRKQHSDKNSKVRLREQRPALLVTSTSWTPDEDFSLLLKAAQIYDAKWASQNLPKLLIFVTGKGPQKEEYQRRMKATDLRHVAFRTLWLDPGDYPLLLGSCDLGLSLHTSSSGLDLPMKVVDMFGCGLPVLTAEYACIDELVQHHVNGLCFSTAEDLAMQLASVLKGFPGDAKLLNFLRAEVLSRREYGSWTWESHWAKVVKPVIPQLCRVDQKSE